MRQRGAVYMALGPSYVAEAAVSAESLRRWHDLPVTVFTDHPERARRTGSFDDVQPITASGRTAHRDKLRAMLASPYPETLFLDTDTYVGACIGDGFDLLQRFDFAAAPDRAYADDFPAGHGVPDCFKEHNLGVVFLRHGPELERVLQDSLHLLDALVAAEPHNPRRYFDQPPFRIEAYRSSLRFASLPLEDNCRFRSYGMINGPVRVLHGRPGRSEFTAANLERILERLNRSLAPRVFVAGRAWAFQPRRLQLRRRHRSVALGRYDATSPNRPPAAARRRHNGQI